MQTAERNSGGLCCSLHEDSSVKPVGYLSLFLSLSVPHTHKICTFHSFDVMIKWDYITVAGGVCLSAFPGPL